jgi:hypothetical protein
MTKSKRNIDTAQLHKLELAALRQTRAANEALVEGRPYSDTELEELANYNVACRLQEYPVG